MSNKKTLEEARKRSNLPFLKAKANYGDETAKLNEAYYNAIGDTPDYKSAFSTFEKYANKNNPDAQYNLGVMYFNGYGVEKDDKEAKKWFKKAAEQGIDEAKKIIRLYYNT